MSAAPQCGSLNYKVGVVLVLLKHNTLVYRKRCESLFQIINLLEELKSKNIDTFSTAPSVFCKALEDNLRVLELAKSPKMTSRTKHINISYHYFREHVRLRIIQLFPFSTTEQLADIYIKPLQRGLFIKFRKSIMGWQYYNHVHISNNIPCRKKREYSNIGILSR